MQGFAPWGWMIGSGVYVDDLHQADLTNARTLFRLMEVREAMGDLIEARDVERKILALNDGSLELAMVRRWVTD